MYVCNYRRLIVYVFVYAVGVGVKLTDFKFICVFCACKVYAKGYVFICLGRVLRQDKFCFVCGNVQYGVFVCKVRLKIIFVQVFCSGGKIDV